MLKKILIGLAAIIVVFMIVAALQPSDFRVARTATIAAPPATVFPLINDLHKWQNWSPWADVDPAAKISYAGPADGKDASFTWSGNSKVGEGTMTIIESRPNEAVVYRLDFVRPFAGTSNAEIALKPEGNQTVVTWSMWGKNNFVGKMFSVFVNCDKMMGPEFEKGLNRLKAEVAKSSPQT